MQVRVRGSSESPDPRGLIGFAAAWDCCFSFLHINHYRSPARPRKRDQPQVIRPEGSAAILRWWLLPIHRFFDNAALQQSSGMDHLLQAGVSVPLSGVWSLNTHTHRHPDSYIFHAQSDPISTQSVDHLLSPGASTQAGFSPHLLLRSSSSCFPHQPLCLLSQKSLHIVDY